MSRRVTNVASILDVELALLKIQEKADEGDDEVAHALEDSLWEGVLRTIADGYKAESSELASAALRSTKIHFSRWCA